MRVGILYSRVRAEEKLLFEEFTQRGAEFDLLDDRRLVFDISGGEDSVQYDEYDVIVERCIHHGRGAGQPAHTQRPRDPDGELGAGG